MRGLAALVLLLGCGSPARPTSGDPTAGADTENRSSVSAEPAVRPPASNVPAEPGMLPAPPDVAYVPPDASVSPTGLASRVLRPGTGGSRPGPSARVTVHYTGWTTDGRMFDSSRTRGEPATFPLGALIPGWTEGLQQMVVGEERRFWIPASLAYGDSPRAGAPAGMLVFDVELIAIVP
jgi:peptidylprolyl isomerase